MKNSSILRFSMLFVVVLILYSQVIMSTRDQERYHVHIDEGNQDSQSAELFEHTDERNQDSQSAELSKEKVQSHHGFQTNFNDCTCFEPNYSCYYQPCCAACECYESDCCCEMPDIDWDLWAFPNYLSLSHTEGRAPGYRKGYTTVGIFLAPSCLSTNCFQGFIDGKAYYFNDGKLAASVGGGVRWFGPRSDIAFGVNAYYDYRRFHGHDFNQLGVGFEVLSSLWDVRVNGYIPVGKRTFHDRTSIDFSDGYIELRKKCAYMWSGLDAEVGTWLQRKTECNWFGIYVAGGPYYYFSDRQNSFNEREHSHAFGGRVRALARICDYVDVSVSATYDPVWRAGAQGQISIAIPLDGSLFDRSSCRARSSCCRTNTCGQMTMQPVERNGIIADSHSKRRLKRERESYCSESQESYSCSSSSSSYCSCPSSSSSYYSCPSSSKSYCSCPSSSKSYCSSPSSSKSYSYPSCSDSGYSSSSSSSSRHSCSSSSGGGYTYNGSHSEGYTIRPRQSDDFCSDGFPHPYH